MQLLIISCLFYMSRAEILNIAQGGSSGILPEHTVTAFTQAIEDGAHYIECDVSITRDLYLVCRHESSLNETTDVAEREEFKDKINTYTINGEKVENWFTVDFTLNELKTLRAVQRHAFRDQSHNGLYEIATFEEYLRIATHYDVGIYPEIKDAAWVNSLNILPRRTRFEDLVIEALRAYGYENSSHSCLLQTLDEESLNYIKLTLQSELRLIIRIETYKVESELKRYAENGFYGVACLKTLIRPCIDYTCDWLAEATDIIQNCHKLHLEIHAFTFRNEEIYLANDYQKDPHKELADFEELGVDGMFTDFPATLYLYSFNEINNAVASFTDHKFTVVICMIAIILM